MKTKKASKSAVLVVELGCKGVWLDVGELGTIVESAGQGNFFHSCLRILRGGGNASVHLEPRGKIGPMLTGTIVLGPGEAAHGAREDSACHPHVHKLSFCEHAAFP